MKLVLMPPQDERRTRWLPRLQADLPDYSVVAPATDAEAKAEMHDADGAYGVVPPDTLKTSNKLRWIQTLRPLRPPAIITRN